jgi:hypothetical protein
MLNGHKLRRQPAHLKGSVFLSDMACATSRRHVTALSLSITAPGKGLAVLHP